MFIEELDIDGFAEDDDSCIVDALEIPVMH